MSNIGGLVNPTKLSNTINTTLQLKTNHITIAKYLNLLEDAFLVRKTKRYDIKGTEIDRDDVTVANVVVLPM